MLLSIRRRDRAGRPALWLVACWFAIAPGFAQTNWSGWAQCTATVAGPRIDGNGVFRGQYFHQETQTWQLTGAPPSGTTYPASWTVNGGGWDTSDAGKSWTVNTSVSAPLRIRQRADLSWLVDSEPHWQLTGTWVQVMPFEKPTTTAEFVFPAVISSPNGVSALGSSSRIDTSGTYGFSQPSGLTTQIDCRWYFVNGQAFAPPPPPQQVSVVVPPFKPANAPAGAVFVPITPCRIKDTRITGTRSPGLGLLAGTPTTFAVGGVCAVPATGVTAVSLNITAVPIVPLGSLSIRAGGQPQPAQPLLSAADGLPTANAALLPFGNGSVEITVSDRSHVIVDVNGFFVPAHPKGMTFFPIKPCRALDPVTAGGLAAGAVRNVGVRSACGLPASASAFALFLTVKPQAALGFLTAWKTGDPRPVTSNLNAPDGQMKTNLALVEGDGSGSVSFFVSDAAELAVEVLGFFAPASTAGGLRFHELPGCTAVNTQDPAGPLGGPALPAQVSRDLPISQANCGVPQWARAYALNVIATPLAGPVGLTLQPTGPTNPTRWAVLAGDGEVTAAAQIMWAGQGSLNTFAGAPAHLRLILNGYFD